MIEEKKTDVDVATVKPTVATQTPASPQAIPAIVDSTKGAAPVVLSQAPPISPSEQKPAVDKASSVVAHPLEEKK